MAAQLRGNSVDGENPDYNWNDGWFFRFQNVPKNKLENWTDENPYTHKLIWQLKLQSNQHKFVSTKTVRWIFTACKRRKVFILQETKNTRGKLQNPMGNDDVQNIINNISLIRH